MSEDIMGKKTGLAFGAGKAGYLPLRKSLAERAYDILEEAIITLGLAPGSIISEQELSELTGIGRTPTREAIQRLSRDRLIQVLPKRGLMVSPLDLVGQLNLLELRREVEGLVCRSAARRATLDQRVRFSSIAVDFRSCIVSNDQINFARLDKEFGELCLGMVFKTPCSPRWFEGPSRGTIAS
ncbi:MAG: GntR family transcriptional regulator [Hydrogenophaga sp.]|uniref:GntR family transcriptional regulator n=1 Tax=Hydrogenophaga sp. TaxID=1904254 RepID=UPI002732AC3D|nr:GntR family transcriptional regulator [Hydrogenophaga sp.]MDP3350896.1 GntR family transcriptional regulator [Hydrogenophaga sp.]